MIEVQIEDAGWSVVLPGAEALVETAAAAALAALPRPAHGEVVVLLTNDAEARQKIAFQGFHPLGLRVVGVIIPQQVQDAMDH